MILKAELVTAQILPEGDGLTDMFGFNGSTPGPQLRLSKGQALQVRLQNTLDQPTALHWHGVRLNNAMDGVPYLTQGPVEEGEYFYYDFVLPDAGTYWYHSHNRSWEQVARGLYGALIVEETEPPDVDRDLTVLVDDWRLEETGAQVQDFDDLHDWSHAGRLGNYARVMLEPGATARKGDRLRLRLINVATARIFPLEVAGISGKVVALDGMPLTEPEDIENLVLAPAQRVDIIADVTDPEAVSFIFQTRDGSYDLGKLEIAGENAAPRRSDITPLVPNSVPPPDRDAAIAIDLVMEGGAMSPVATRDAIWLFNGQSGMSDKPLHHFQRGQTARITLRNDTRFPHGIHLHGHHFFELDADGELGHYRDTTLVMAGQSRDILCVFDNPGKWMLHCHMLGHQAGGMKTWVEVA
jgi:FtsP/CotA-like multicopper oxidase with cupredoxin domain